MDAERSEVEELFERQEEERAEFVRGQIKKLVDAGYDWKLPRDFREDSGYEGKGLLIQRNYCGQSYIHKVLSPDEGLIYVQRDMPNRPVALIGGGMTGSGISDLESLERAVNEALESLQNKKKFPIFSRR